MTLAEPRRSILLASLLFLLAGCASPPLATRSEFDQMRRKGDPKMTTWYYVGSREGFHYFYFVSFGGGLGKVRVPESELAWKDTFPLTREFSRWKTVQRKPKLSDYEGR